MPINDFIGFASSGSANIASQVDYAAAAEQGIGMQPGPASSKLANKAWRQGANMAAALGNIANARGFDTLDNGDIASLAGNLDDALSIGTFNRMFFSQTSGSYTAPRTGVYRITLKGGGGGGSGARTDLYCSGAGGGEGATIVFYITLTENQAYPYIIGAGGAGGTSGDTNTSTRGIAGGDSSFNGNYSAQGGSGAQRLNGGGTGGGGGISITAPTGAQYYRIPGLQGQSSIIGNGKWYTAYTIGGGQSSSTADRKYGLGGCGACGSINATSQTIAQEAQAGSDGFILIEYAE